MTTEGSYSCEENIMKLLLALATTALIAVGVIFVIGLLIIKAVFDKFWEDDR